MGAYNLIIHEYGHDFAIGSVHIEISSERESCTSPFILRVNLNDELFSFEGYRKLNDKIGFYNVF